MRPLKPLPREIRDRIVQELGPCSIEATGAKGDVQIYFSALGCKGQHQHGYYLTANGMHKRIKREHTMGLKALVCRICQPDDAAHAKKPPSRHELRLYALLQSREEYKRQGIYVACAEAKVLRGKFGAVDIWLLWGKEVGGWRSMLEIQVDGEGHTEKISTNQEALMQQIWRDEEHNSWAVCEAACSVVRLYHRDTSDAWHAAIQAAMQQVEATAAMPKVFFSPAYGRRHHSNRLLRVEG